MDGLFVAKKVGGMRCPNAIDYEAFFETYLILDD